MHISKMSHRHFFGEVRVCQVCPTAVSALNIGTKNVSFGKGLEGVAGRQGDRVLEGTEHLSQSFDFTGKVISKSLLTKSGTLASSFQK